MRLDELPWEDDPEYGPLAHFELPSGNWLWIRKSIENGLYDIYEDHNDSATDEIRYWDDADPLLAQCVVYELFGVTPTGNEHGGEDGDTGKAA